MSEDLHEYHHYLRHWGVRDLFESPLLDSVLEHVRRHFYQLFYDQRHEKSAPWYTAGFGLEHGKGPLQPITAPLQKTQIPLSFHPRLTRAIISRFIGTPKHMSLVVAVVV